MNIVPIYVSQIMCTNFLTVANRLLVILGRRVFSKSWSTFTLVRSNSVVTDVVWMACIWRLALIDICRFTNKGRKEKCLTFLKVFSECKALQWDLKLFCNIKVCLYVLCRSSSAHTGSISGTPWFTVPKVASQVWDSLWVFPTKSKTRRSLLMKRRSQRLKRRSNDLIRNYCVRTKY